MQELEQYGVEQLTETEQAAVSGGDPLSDGVMRFAGAVVGACWFVIKLAGSATDMEYVHL
jgi:hypothetical protein